MPTCSFSPNDPGQQHQLITARALRSATREGGCLEHVTAALSNRHAFGRVSLSRGPGTARGFVAREGIAMFGTKSRLASLTLAAIIGFAGAAVAKDKLTVYTALEEE